MRQTITRIFVATLVLLGFALTSNAQNVGINTDGSNPHESAMLDIVSTDKGLLIPRVELKSATDPIANPVLGLLVFNKDANYGKGVGFYYFDGTDWQMVGKGLDEGSTTTPGGTPEILVWDGSEWTATQIKEQFSAPADETSTALVSEGAIIKYVNQNGGPKDGTAQDQILRWNASDSKWEAVDHANLKGLALGSSALTVEHIHQAITTPNSENEKALPTTKAVVDYVGNLTGVKMVSPAPEDKYKVLYVSNEDGTVTPHPHFTVDPSGNAGLVSLKTTGIVDAGTFSIGNSTSTVEDIKNEVDPNGTTPEKNLVTEKAVIDYVGDVLPNGADDQLLRWSTDGWVPGSALQVNANKVTSTVEAEFRKKVNIAELTLGGSQTVSAITNDLNAVSGANESATLPTVNGVKKYVADKGIADGSSDGQTLRWDAGTSKWAANEIFTVSNSGVASTAEFVALGGFRFDKTGNSAETIVSVINDDNGDVSLPTEKAVKDFVDELLEKGTKVGQTLYWDGTTWLANEALTVDPSTGVSSSEDFTAKQNLEVDKDFRFQTGNAVETIVSAIAVDAKDDKSLPTEKAVKDFVNGLLKKGTKVGQTLYWDGTTWLANETLTVSDAGVTSTADFTAGKNLIIAETLSFKGTTANAVETVVSEINDVDGNISLPTEKAVKDFVDNLLEKGTKDGETLRWDNTNETWIAGDELTVSTEGVASNVDLVAKENLSVNQDLTVTGGIKANTTFKFQTGNEAETIVSAIDGLEADKALPTEKAVKDFVDNLLEKGTKDGQTLRWNNTEETWIAGDELTVSTEGVASNVNLVAKENLSVNNNLYVAKKIQANDKFGFQTGNEVSTIVTVVDDMDNNALPTEGAVKGYVDNLLEKGTKDGQTLRWDASVPGEEKWVANEIFTVSNAGVASTVDFVAEQNLTVDGETKLHDGVTVKGTATFSDLVVFQPKEQTVSNPATGMLMVESSYVKINDTDNRTVKMIQRVGGAYTGQILIIENISSTKELRIENTMNVKLKGGNSAAILGKNDTMMLIFSGNKWIELSRNSKASK